MKIRSGLLSQKSLQPPITCIRCRKTFLDRFAFKRHVRPCLASRKIYSVQCDYCKAWVRWRVGGLDVALDDHWRDCAQAKAAGVLPVFNPKTGRARQTAGRGFNPEDFHKHRCARAALARMSEGGYLPVDVRLELVCKNLARHIVAYRKTENPGAVAMEKMQRRLSATTRRRVKLEHFLRENPWLREKADLDLEVVEFCHDAEILLTHDTVQAAVLKIEARIDREFTPEVQTKRAVERLREIAELNSMFALPPKRKRGRPKKASMRKGGAA